MQQIVLFIFSATLMLLVTACSSVPVTGRSQINLIPASSLMSMSLQQYGQFLQENKLSANHQQTEMVKRVGQRISKAVEQYLSDNGFQDQLQNYQWEFNLVEDPQVNAWCMPGGKVVVYTGILPIAGDENGLAVVMGHEVAHAVAGHGNERMSHQLLTQAGGMALSTALASKSAQTQQLWMMAYGLGAEYGAVLPYSRMHESEADHLGLVFMTMAGYDPNAAVSFWQRMATGKGGQTVPEFTSTHPSDETRINNIKRLIPEVLQKYHR